MFQPHEINRRRIVIKVKEVIKKPVIILGCPRSGTTILFTLLSESRHLYSLYNESRFIFKKFYEKKLKEGKKYFNDALSESDLDDSSKELLLSEFHKYSLNSRIVGLGLHKILRKKMLLRPFVIPLVETNKVYKDLFLKDYRLVEKTPRNCFRIPFLNKLFPDAKYIYLKRDGRANISSLLEGWRKRKSVKKRYPGLNLPLEIKNYNGKTWHFALSPGWEEYRNKTLAEVCAFQWLSANKAVTTELGKLTQDKICKISYEDLCDYMPDLIKKVCEFIDIPYEGKVRKMAEKPPVVNTFSKPSKDKWRKNAKELEKIYPMIEPVMRELGYKMEDEKFFASI